MFNICFQLVNQIYLIVLGHLLQAIMPKPMQQLYNIFPLWRVQFSEVQNLLGQNNFEDLQSLLRQQTKNVNHSILQFNFLDLFEDNEVAFQKQKEP